jgi:hypothetical protein
MLGLPSGSPFVALSLSLAQTEVEEDTRHWSFSGDERRYGRTNTQISFSQTSWLIPVDYKSCSRGFYTQESAHARRLPRAHVCPRSARPGLRAWRHYADDAANSNGSSRLPPLLSPSTLTWPHTSVRPEPVDTHTSTYSRHTHTRHICHGYGHEHERTDVDGHHTIGLFLTQARRRESSSSWLLARTSTTFTLDPSRSAGDILSKIESFSDLPSLAAPP